MASTLSSSRPGRAAHRPGAGVDRRQTFFPVVRGVVAVLNVDVPAAAPPGAANTELVPRAVETLEAVEPIDVAEAVAHAQPPLFRQRARRLQDHQHLVLEAFAVESRVREEHARFAIPVTDAQAIARAAVDGQLVEAVQVLVVERDQTAVEAPRPRERCADRGLQFCEGIVRAADAEHVAAGDQRDVVVIADCERAVSKPVALGWRRQSRELISCERPQAIIGGFALGQREPLRRWSPCARQWRPTPGCSAPAAPSQACERSREKRPQRATTARRDKHTRQC